MHVPLRIPCARHASRLPKMFRFSEVYKEKTYDILSCKRSKIGTFLNAEWRCGGGFQRGGAPRSEFIITMLAGGKHTTLSLAFSECPLKSPFFGTFLGEARKVHNAALTKRYTYLQFTVVNPNVLC